jgi:hypothetical protein
LAFLFAACASSQQSSGPPVTVQLTQLGGSSNIFYFPGPVNVQYEVAVNNPTDQAITMRRLDCAPKDRARTRCAPADRP